jgi:hypothetical protein
MIGSFGRADLSIRHITSGLVASCSQAEAQGLQPSLSKCPGLLGKRARARGYQACRWEALMLHTLYTFCTLYTHFTLHTLPTLPHCC